MFPFFSLALSISFNVLSINIQVSKFPDGIHRFGLCVVVFSFFFLKIFLLRYHLGIFFFIYYVEHPVSTFQYENSCFYLGEIFFIVV